MLAKTRFFLDNYIDSDWVVIVRFFLIVRVAVTTTMDEDFDAEAGDAMDTDDELNDSAPYTPPSRSIPEQIQYVTLYFCSSHQLSILAIDYNSSMAIPSRSIATCQLYYSNTTYRQKKNFF